MHAGTSSFATYIKVIIYFGSEVGVLVTAAQPRSSAFADVEDNTAAI